MRSIVALTILAVTMSVASAESNFTVAQRLRLAQSADACSSNCDGASAACRRICPATSAPCLSSCDSQLQTCRQSCQSK